MRLLLAFLIFVSNFCWSSPIYLDCFTKNDANEIKTFSISLDESNRKVTQTYNDGSAFNSEGFWSANKISYQNIKNVGPIIVTDRFDINRTNLKINEYWEAKVANPDFSKKIPPKTINSKGNCKIIKPGHRKI